MDPACLVLLSLTHKFFHFFDTGMQKLRKVRALRRQNDAAAYLLMPFQMTLKGVSLPLPNPVGILQFYTATVSYCGGRVLVVIVLFFNLLYQLFFLSCYFMNIAPLLTRL